MAQLEHIEAIEKRLWSASDTLRANSNYASNEYFLPVMGLVFLRHAYSSGRQRAQVSCFQEFCVPVPPNVLREEFDRKPELIFREITTLIKQNEFLVKARDLLLPRLMNGEIPI
jgi:hypothetical protein